MPKFTKGRSGNPGGRSRIPPEVKDLARDYTVEAMKTLYAVMSNKRSTATARVAAANAILDRGWGKATQHIEAHVDLLDRLSYPEQEALASALAMLAAGDPGSEAAEDEDSAPDEALRH